MTTQFRTAYYCGGCWQELGRLPLHGCECGAVDMLKRSVPVRRDVFRTGLEPIFALWAEGWRALWRRWLRARIEELGPLHPRVPRLRIKLAALEHAERERR